ncbi:unnamed protein product [Closterium sp. Naga37s-1]|nr:unnamed protein product [Closterium sp. Naga37s-1]
MPVSIGDEYCSYSPRPFVVASAAVAPPALSSPAPAAVGMSPLPGPRSAPSSVTQAGLVLAPAAPPVPVVASLSVPGLAPGHAPASSPAPALASASAPAPAQGSAAASDPAHTPAPAPVVPPVPVGVSVPVPVVAASSAAVGEASALPLAAPAVAPSAAAGADPTYPPPPATSAGLSSAEVQSARVSPPDAPAPLHAAATVPPPTVQAGPAPAPLAPVPPAQHPPSPGRRQHRPHSPPVTMADLQRVVSDAMREERNGQASVSNSPRVAPAPVSLPPAAPHAPAPPHHSSAAPPPRAPVASVAPRGNRLRLPWVPPVAGVEFVTLGGGPVTPQYPTLLPVAPAPPAADLPVHSLVGPSPSADVPEASLGQLWRLSEGLRAVHLIQVYCHAALSRGVPLEGGPLDECSDASDRLAELLAPVLAAPARGGVAGVGQLGTALRGLRRAMRAATAVDLIGATTVVVRELHRSLTGLLAVFDADQM